MVLEYNGFTQFKIKKNSRGIWELDISEENKGKPTFALYTGTESSEEKEMVRNIYNGNWDSKSPITAELKLLANDNSMGEIIKVLMITSSGSEGINLRNTRYVHIMEPYWHPTRTEQVIGRARRICSHKDLPEQLQTVDVFVYLMKFTSEQIKSDKSTELKLKDLSKKKYRVMYVDIFEFNGKNYLRSADTNVIYDIITSKPLGLWNETKQEIDLEVIPDKKTLTLEFIPFTSDETLFEISTIKEDVNNKLLTAVKEASIDCAIYSKLGSKEQLHCLQFEEPSPNDFSYKPSIFNDQLDDQLDINKKITTWKGTIVEINGENYVRREMSKKLVNLYDVDSYYKAQENPANKPQLVATIENSVFKKI